MDYDSLQDEIEALGLGDYIPPERNGHQPAKPQGGTRNRLKSAIFSNFKTEEVQAESGTTTITTGLPVAELGRQLMELTHGWPKRVVSQLFAEGPNHKPLWLESTDALFAWIGRTLPGSDANGISWGGGHDKVTKAEFFCYLQQTAECFDAVEAFPHWPPLPHHYYMHPGLKGGNGKALRALLERFQPATDVDGDLIRAFFLSLVWGGDPGQRPAWLFTCEDGDHAGGRGVGKSKIVHMGARLVGGHVDGSPSEPMAQLITRLLSTEGIDKRVVLLDNLKTLRFSWSELEGLITNVVISGHRMYAGEGRRPNTLTYCLTLNGASLSRDMAQRSVIVKMKRPTRDPEWEAETAALIENKRWAIIGDIIAALKEEASPLAKHSRWAPWENAVLSRIGDPAECQRVIEERQSEVDEDASEADTVREAFLAELQKHHHDAAHSVVWFSAKTVAEIVNDATNEKRPTNKATAYLRTLVIKELRESRRGSGRGWTWWGVAATADTRAVHIDPLVTDFKA